MIRVSSACALLLFALGALALPAAATTYEDYKVAILQGLDKVTGRVARLSIPVGSNTMFGDLTVTARACKKTPPEELPEAVAFLEIDAPADTTASRAAKQAQKLQNKLQRWYSGWMFASDPSLATLEHPVYDVTVIDCEQPVTPEPQATDAPLNSATTVAPSISSSPAVDEAIPEDTDAN